MMKASLPVDTALFWKGSSSMKLLKISRCYALQLSEYCTSQFSHD